MGDWPVHASIGNSVFAGGGVAIATHASAHTKGAYAVLIASTPFDSNLLMLSIDNSTAVFDFLFIPCG